METGLGYIQMQGKEFRDEWVGRASFRKDVGRDAFYCPTLSDG
jgi:hypothetical protein